MRVCDVSYEAPARFDDLLEVFVRTSESGARASLRVLRVRVEDDVLMCTAEQTLVLVAVPERGRRPISAATARAVEQFEGRTSSRGAGRVSATTDAYRGGLEAVDRIVNREPEADEVLRGRRSRCSTTASSTTPGSGSTSSRATTSCSGPWKGRGDRARAHPDRPGHLRRRRRDGATEIVDDVNADDRYLACFVSTRSEIVVPIAYEGRVVGEIDIDSDAARAFGDEDREFLERVAAPHLPPLPRRLGHRRRALGAEESLQAASRRVREQRSASPPGRSRGAAAIAFRPLAFAW